ncbi:MAG: DNA translocase FtsK 4TM domain-containing protein, partial [Hydrogenophaga sp.]
MTYSLNTLNADRASASAPGVSRFAQEIGLVLGAAALAFWLLALLSHSLADPAWSTTGTRAEVGNWGGRVGALVADGSYFLFGFSVWWGFFIGLRAWLSGLATWIRGQQGLETVDGSAVADPERFWHKSWVRRSVFWLGLAVLLCASAVLEWSRLYRMESLLPGNAGGMLGQALGPAALQWLGFTGSALVMLVLWVLCLPVVFRFSWGHW